MKPIPGRDGYFINEDGTRVVGPGRWRPRDLTIQVHEGHGRLRVKVNNRYRYVHELVALTFIGPRPEGLEVRHLDDDFLNNHWTNLAYGTSKENCADSIAAGTHISVRRRNQTRCKREHEFTAANTYLEPKTGKRQCVTCRRMLLRESRARRKQSV